jgi:hypothetical protein
MSSKLNRLLAHEPGQNPFALELNLKGKAENIKGEYVNDASDWELIEDTGQRPYYYNRKTHLTTYDNPEEMNKPPPPPPPRAALPGLGGVPPPPPRRPTFLPPIGENTVSNNNEREDEEEEPQQLEQIPEEESASAEYSEPSANNNKASNGWVYVCHNEPTPYYWNMTTNETTFEAPAAWDGTIYGEDNTNNGGSSSSQIIWQEQINENGEVFYYNTSDGSQSSYKPAGQTVIAVLDDEGNETNWQEFDENGSMCYMNSVTGEVISEKPQNGTVLILQNS